MLPFDADVAAMDDVFISPAMTGYTRPRVSLFALLRRMLRRWQAAAVAGYPAA